MKPARTPGQASAQGSARSRGVTLIELMVTITIGLFMVASLGYVYLASTQVFRTLEANSRVQENLRFAFERLGNEIRTAGNLGCSATTTANVLNNASQWAFDILGLPLIGYEDDVSAFPSEIDTKPSERLRGDALTVLFADSTTQARIVSHNPNSAVVFTPSAGNFNDGDIVVATDCSHAAVFQITNVSASGANPQIVHNTGNSVSPGNCAKLLGSTPTSCGGAAGTSFEFTGGSVLRLTAHTYFIRNNAQGEPSLYRLALRTASGNATTSTAEEIVPGIEDMQILYGVDTDGTADGAVNTYVTADEVANVAPGATLAEQWRRVLAVRINLLASSYAGQEPNVSQQTFRFNGADVTATDRRVRKAMTMTVAIRNRL